MVDFFDKEKKIADRKASLIFLVIGLIAILYVGWMIWDSFNNPELDANGCPIQGAYSEHVVLFDQTDTSKDKPIVEKDARKFLEKIKKKVPKYSRLSIYVITDDPKGTNIKAKVERCNPGYISNLNIFGKMGITVTVKKYMDNWNKNFNEIINPIIDEIMRKTSSPSSPIFEMINVVSIKNFKHSKSRYVNKLIIFSDFMHHTNEYSFYNSQNIDLKKFIETPYSKEVYTSLRNIVDVELYCYKRHDNEQCGKKIEDFWNEYFDHIDDHKLDFHRIGS